MKLINRCDATVRVEGQMPDLSTSPALRIMQKPKVSNLMEGLNSLNRGKFALCSCNNYYQNELGIDVATKFMSFVRRQYPGDTQRQVESLYVKLLALNSMINRLQPVQKREAGVTADVLLSMIDRMKVDVSPLPRRYSHMEAHAYNVPGRIALDEGTEDSARRAVVHFENDLKVREAIGDDEGAANAKNNIASAKYMYESGINEEELLKISQELYKLRVAQLGEKNELTIEAGKFHAINLQVADRGGEARELLTKLLATSKQVLGHHHSTTKDVEMALEQVVDNEDSDSSDNNDENDDDK